MAIARAYLLNMMGIYIVVLLCCICSENSIITDAQAGKGIDELSVLCRRNINIVRVDPDSFS